MCTVYNDRQRTELGVCDYQVVCEVLGQTLNDNTRYQYGLSQMTLDKLNLQMYAVAALSENVDKRSNSKHLNINLSMQDEIELRHEIARDNASFRQKERNTTTKSNSTKVTVITNSI